MKNLGIRSISSRHATLVAKEEVLEFCINSADELLYLVSTEHRVICLQADGKVAWNVPLHLETPSPTLVSFTYVMELEGLCIAWAAGELQLLHLGNMELEEVGFFQGGVVSLEWSPDGETFALLTGLGNLLLMNRDWELLEEVPLPLSAPELGAVDGLGAAASISWRGDGKVLATNVIDGDNRLIHVWSRDGCNLESTAEELRGSSSVMAWQPNGRHLYVAAVGDDGGHRVQLFERNGLQHGVFDATGVGKVTSLTWSTDSELLAIVRAPAAGKVQDPGAKWTVQVWHRNCWHWFLKYELQVPNAGGRLLAAWDDTALHALHLMTATGTMTTLQFYWSITTTDKGTIAVVDGCDLMLTPLRRMMIPPPTCAVRGRFPTAISLLALTQSLENEAAAVLLSDGRLGILKSPVGDKWEDAEKYVDPSPQTPSHTNPGKSAEVHITPNILTFSTSLPTDRIIQALAWLSDSTLLAVAVVTPPSDNAAAEEGGSVLLEIQLNAECSKIVGVSEVPEPALFTHAVSRPGGDGLLQSSSGELFSYSIGGKVQPQTKSTCFPSCCTHVYPVPLLEHSTTYPPLLGLTAAGVLYWGSRNLAGECTSVAVRAAGPGGPALLYTTRNHKLHVRFFADLLSNPNGQESAAQLQPEKRVFRSQLQQRSAFSAAMRPAGADEASHDIMQRSVEQGSIIVAAPSNTVRVALLMPRGNLEGIAPRGLLLAALCQALQERRFSEAWQAATTHRVDLNLVVDYMWPAFLQHTEEVVSAIDDPADLCDLLHALKPGSVVEPGGIYYPLPGPMLPARLEPAVDKLEGGKVTAVCRAVRETVEQIDPKKYLLVRVTSYARSDPPDLPSALKCVAEAKEAALAQGITEDSLAEKALRHLLLTVDGDTLEKAALGTYDLALAYMVAVQAGKDPGEQLLQLQEFEEEDNEHLRKYKIDVYLKRYSAAIRNLMEAGPEEHVATALKLAKQHGLMRELMLLCPPESPAHLHVLEAWADLLQAGDKLEDAALALLAAGQVEKAIGSYKAAGQWKMALALGSQQGYTPQQLQGLAQEVVEQLHAWGDHVGMAAVLEQYLGDVDNAVSALTTAREWREALRVSQRNGRPDLVETVVAPSAAESASNILQEAHDNVDRIAKYLQRLQDVQRKRAAMQDALQDDDDKPDMDDDLNTEASTVAGLSIYTDATHTQASTASSTRNPSTVGGKKPLRHMRKNKKGRVRPGTAQEEAMLIDHIRELGPSDAMLSQVGQLTELLVLLGHRDDASKLQQKVALWQAKHQDAVQELDRAAAEQAASSNAGAQLGISPAAGKTAAGAAATKAVDKKAQVQWKWEILRPLT